MIISQYDSGFEIIVFMSDFSQTFKGLLCQCVVPIKRPFSCPGNMWAPENVITKSNSSMKLKIQSNVTDAAINMKYRRCESDRSTYLRQELKSYPKCNAMALFILEIQGVPR
jgi:hypothetical protein